MTARRPKRVSIGLFAMLFAYAALWGTSSFVAYADSTDLRFIDGLRERRLYPLADSFCQQRLRDPLLTPAERGQLTRQTIRVLAEFAVESAPAERPELWRRARETAGQFVRQFPDHAHRPLIEYQDIMTLLARGELARQEAEMGANSEAAWTQAKDDFRLAIRQLGSLEDRVARAKSRGRASTSADGALSRGELDALVWNLQRQTARAYRNQAMCYPAQSDDRVASLAKAVSRLENTIQAVADDNDLIWDIRLELGICQRLLADYAAARRSLAGANQDETPPDVRLAMRAETARLELAASNPQAAWKALAAGREIQGQTSADVDFAFFETALALWRAAQAAGNEQESSTWRDKTLAAAEFIEQRHGAYWARRAELLLVHAAPQQTGSQDVEILVRSADNLYLEGMYDEAVSAYDKVGQLAGDSGESGRAFDAFFRAALVRHKQGQIGEAIDRLTELAASRSEDPRASTAHFRAIVLAVELARRDTGELGLYETLLQQHLAHWPQSPNGDNVRLWYGKLLESREQWRAALTQYDQVAPAAAETWRPAVLAAAGIRLRQAGSDYADVQRRLEAALDQSADAAGKWRAEAQALLAVSLARQASQSARAAEMFPQLAAPTVETGLLVLECLERAAGEASDDRRQTLASMSLDMANLLEPALGQLNDQQRQWYQRLRAAALAASGRREEALADYRQLVQAYPANAAVQQGYAELLEKGEAAETLKEALTQWRRVGRSCPLGSDRWYRAKYGVAFVLYRQGNKEEASQLIRYVQATQGLEDTPLERQFLDLLSRCGD